MLKQPLTKYEAKKLVLAEAAKYPTSSPLADGRVQMRVDIGWMVSHFCRTDATGRISKRDREAIHAAIAELEKDGILKGESNGYPLLVDRGYPAQEAHEKSTRTGRWGY